MKRLLKTLGVFLAATIAGYLAALFGGVLLMEAFNVSQREGAAAMGLAFVIAPMIAVIVGLAATMWFLVAKARPHEPAA